MSQSTTITHKHRRRDAEHKKYCEEMIAKYGEDWDADDFLENEEYFKDAPTYPEPEGDPSY